MGFFKNFRKEQQNKVAIWINSETKKKMLRGNFEEESKRVNLCVWFFFFRCFGDE